MKSIKAIDSIKIIFLTILFFACEKKNETPALWLKEADFPGTKRKFAGGMSMNGKGYVIFGDDGGFGSYQLNDIWEFNPQKKDWNKIAIFNEPIKRAGPVLCTTIDNSIYILTSFGPETTLVKYFVEFDTKNLAFKKIEIPSDLNISLNLIFSNKRNLYFQASSFPQGASQPSFKFYKYNIDQGNWKELPFLDSENSPVSEAYGITPTFSIKDNLYLFNRSGFLWMFDTQTEMWQNLGNPGLKAPTGERVNSFNCVINNYVYFIGGDYFFGNIESQRVFRYDSKLNSLKELENLPYDYPASGAAGFVLDNIAYMCMGGTKYSIFKDVWTFKGDER